ncbi:tRNA pseudouridine synthase A isoform X2 [Lingula anatina]|uniref:Pseudouridylate synthase 1 homolog n=1 Tax=Lingula anatina TaxID=7574 RepID=A0A1S3HAZ1_LINAN|nr:tRNA pseudouridine synthase A isoform X2 [Lingula anatina]|eukprot:XP_013383207.1 tRNA pseudouridine synthase A isoform X2 [Lingula anatina]
MHQEWLLKSCGAFSYFFETIPRKLLRFQLQRAYLSTVDPSKLTVMEKSDEKQKASTLESREWSKTGSPSNESTDIKNLSDTQHAVKRTLEGDERACKVPKLGTDEHHPSPSNILRKRKVALLLAYSGSGYMGMQIQKDVTTIETDLVSALYKAGVIPEEHAEEMQKMKFQRAARTDKGVSAAMQLCSLKMLLPENCIEKINERLPAQIKVFSIKRVTQGFNSKNNCDNRTYSYLMPTYAFTPVEQNVTEDFKISDDSLKLAREVLSMFKGTHNFHNFTAGKKATDPSAKRYIIDIQCGEPFVQEGLEFITVTVRGQSFMLHQIRKMIGLTIAVVRGLAAKESVQQAFEHPKMDIPKAPGLGLLLEKLHYDAYNKRYGKDGLHETLDWEDIRMDLDKFKAEQIYPTIIQTELKEKSMLQWLQTLHLHTFMQSEEEYGVETPKLRDVWTKVKEFSKEKQEASKNEEK